MLPFFSCFVLKGLGVGGWRYLKKKTNRNITKQKSHISNNQGLYKATMKFADMSVQIPGLREASLAPLAPVGFLPGVHDRVAAEVVGILEALPALAAGVGLLPRVSPLVPL